ncbi:lactate racemase domain-containing protein [Acidiferrimicrobium sp. IK]|uniref:lactate racemase domain-containing protein n=1 Tax=Acidiferrimicrobium sp. IK TaxID=2871700 RepID=UPI0021CB2AF3|nr:lactate racemase domain-containing protein [Acidiferrimicrobium sp. IK]MCU4184345.1 lactate racemase domain-containing protein [Acidiferrimicrobium sp. IK]
MQAWTVGDSGSLLSADEIIDHLKTTMEKEALDGARVCVVVPDATRHCPLPLLLTALYHGLGGRPAEVSVVVALGTHPAMPEDALGRLVGPQPAGVSVHNHEWWDPAALVELGELPAREVRAVSEGRLDTAVAVRVNRRVAEADVVVLLGPVLPHEVVGFSGGNKYLFPGVSGPEMIDVSHWLGALLTSSAIIGRPGTTPVRALIDRAAALVPGRRIAICAVTEAGGDGLHALSVGDPEVAWADAAAIAARTHIERVAAPFPRVLSLVAERYDELWTAAKGVYKVDPVLADGGTVVLYAPHVRRVSETHGADIARVGYHCRDYITGQWDRFRDLPWGVLAHSTHVRGSGTWDPVAGERCRTTVALATGISREETEALGLVYVDPDSIDPDEWAADPATLVVPDAGETLYRLQGDG